MIKAIVFDLDDTLYPEMDYVKSGFSVVAAAAKEKYGISDGDGKLMRLFELNKSGVFDRFSAENGLSAEAAGCFVETYRNHKPNITLSDEVRDLLIALRQKGFKLGIITDGRPQGQRNKIAALGLAELTDEIIVTDELGGVAYRKPDPKAFEMMCKVFDIRPEEMVYVGDNPQKDFAVKKFLPVKTIEIRLPSRIRQNEKYYEGIKPEHCIADITGILKVVSK